MERCYGIGYDLVVGEGVGGGGGEMGVQIDEFAFFVFHLDVGVVVSELRRRCFV